MSTDKRTPAEQAQYAEDRQQVVDDLTNLVEADSAFVGTSADQARLMVAIGRALLVLLAESKEAGE